MYVVALLTWCCPFCSDFFTPLGADHVPDQGHPSKSWNPGPSLDMSDYSLIVNMFEFSILFKSRQTYDVDAARGMRCGVSLALWTDVMVKDGGNWFLLWITKSTTNQQFTNNNGNISANMEIELKIINSCKSMVISQLFGRVFAQSLAGFFSSIIGLLWAWAPWAWAKQQWHFDTARTC